MNLLNVCIGIFICWKFVATKKEEKNTNVLKLLCAARRRVGCYFAL